jgi:uncharacterized membrane protein SpoIIM required for sporulation
VDIEAFAAAHEPTWNRLEELTRRRRLDGAGADELVALYQRASTNLSQLRTHAPDPALVARLSTVLAAAQARVTGAHESSSAVVKRFFAATMPVALYRLRWWSVGALAGLVGVAVMAGAWVAASPAALALLGPPSVREHYVSEAFESYYSEYSHASFAALVWTNNAQLALICVATGITGLIPAYLLLSNAVSVGAMGGLMVTNGAGGVFFALIAPHGLLELTALAVAAAAGFHLFWTWLVPGPRPRARALGEQGRATVAVVAATTLALALSGLIEGFVTPSGLPWWAKVVIGALACAAFWFYVFVIGRRAAGLLDADDEPAHLPLAA